jgi:hypothetical protein
MQRLPRFTARDLILAAIILALCGAWFVEHWRMRTAQLEVKKAYEFGDGKTQHVLRTLELELRKHGLEIVLDGEPIDYKVIKHVPFTPPEE